MERGRRFSLPTLRIFTEFGFAWSSNSIIPLIQSQPRTPFPLSRNTPPAATHAHRQLRRKPGPHRLKATLLLLKQCVLIRNENDACVFLKMNIYFSFFYLSGNVVVFWPFWIAEKLSNCRSFWCVKGLSSQCRSLGVSYALSFLSLSFSLSQIWCGTLAQWKQIKCKVCQ